MKKNILLTMLLLMATMTFAACTGKKSTIQKDAAAQTDTFKTKSGKEIVFTAIKHGSIVSVSVFTYCHKKTDQERRLVQFC